VGRTAKGRGGAFAGAGPPTTLENRSSPTGEENGGWSTGILLRGSPGLGRWCSG
jgi:hypothetical protein